MSLLAAATEAYQALLEGHRRDPDDEELWEDLQKARAAMEIAWLERAVNGPGTGVTSEHARRCAISVGGQAGYAVVAVATHTLIAVPWTDEAVSPAELVARIADALPGVIRGPCRLEPHGRRVWEIAPGDDAWSIEISVMPRRRP